MEKIPILGVVVGKRQIQIENDKVKAIKEWKYLPKSRKLKAF